MPLAAPIKLSEFSLANLKDYSIDQLKELAQVVRRRIIDVLSVRGGHLASSLGAIELIIALHRVFCSPEDPFIFDVGHQAYAHKILTSRDEDFSKLRQTGGASGFCSPEESKHDPFFTGHAGVALSQALGVAKSRDLAKKDFFVLPILGDASLTCGVTLEALNNVPSDLRRFIVVVNDNKMSIAPNVGAIATLLGRLLNSPTTQRVCHEASALISKVPGYGKQIALGSAKIKTSLQSLVSPAAFFEHFNLAYVGPVDGHDISALVGCLEEVKSLQVPVLLHVHTIKGAGLDCAINNPISFHGCRPFDKETGSFAPASKHPTFPQIFGSHLYRMAVNDSDIVAITPATPVGACLDLFMSHFPERCLDVGIAEGHAVTFAGGLAYGGRKVVCSLYSTFFQRSFDNLFHDVCLQKLPVLFAIDRAGLSAADGSSHHGIYDLSFLQVMPHLIIAQPRDGRLLQELLNSAFSWNAPVVIRYPNAITTNEEACRDRLPGEGEIIRQGEGMVIIALGNMAQVALELAELLLSYNVNATVVDPIFVKPLDTALLSSVLKNHDRWIILEEHSIKGGIGVAILAWLAQGGRCDIHSLHCAIPDTFMGHGSMNDILLKAGLDKGSLLSRIIEAFTLKKHSLAEDFSHACCTPCS